MLIGIGGIVSCVRFASLVGTAAIRGARVDAGTTRNAKLASATGYVAASRSDTAPKAGSARIGLALLGRWIRTRQARAIRHACAVLANEVLRTSCQIRLLADIAEIDAFAGDALLPGCALDVRAAANTDPCDTLLIRVAGDGRARSINAVVAGTYLPRLAGKFAGTCTRVDARPFVAVLPRWTEGVSVVDGAIAIIVNRVARLGLGLKHWVARSSRPRSRDAGGDARRTKACLTGNAAELATTLANHAFDGVDEIVEVAIRRPGFAWDRRIELRRRRR